MTGPTLDTAKTDLKTNNMDAPPHREIYEQGYEMRKRVVGEEYVERSLKANGSDFMRPLQQFATVSFGFSFLIF
jgi:4-carboxymuconolactone decarboxylase